MKWLWPRMTLAPSGTRIFTAWRLSISCIVTCNNLFVLSRLMASALLIAAALSGASSIVDRVGSTAFIQVEAESFKTLTAKQQALGYWLGQAAIAMDPVIYDQMSRFGLRQKRVLEAVVANKAKVEPALYAKILDFTKLFWAGKGNHNDYTSQKILPAFTANDLKKALEQAGHKELVPEVDSLSQSLFDPNFEPMITAKSPQGGLDILQASSNNFYFGVTLAELKGFQEKNPLNSRITKENGKLIEQVYRAGTPDGKIPPGFYAQYLAKANEML